MNVLRKSEKAGDEGSLQFYLDKDLTTNIPKILD